MFIIEFPSLFTNDGIYKLVQLLEGQLGATYQDALK